MRVFTLLLFIASVFLQSLYGQNCGDRYYKKIFDRTIVTRNIYYGENTMSNNRIKKMHFDVYEPQGDSSKNRMVLVMMHGGAYWSGDKNHGQCKFLGEDLSKMGYVVISPQYRYEPSFLSLLDQEKMVKAVARGTQDARAIIRYLFKDVMEDGNTWGVDTSMIFIGGASAGAFNALHATYLDDADELPEDWKRWMEEAGGSDGTTAAVGYPYKVAGVISISGALAKASILDNESIPFLSVHDIEDPQVPFNSGQPYSITTMPVVDGSNVLHAKALEVGIENPFYIIPGKGHTSYEEFGFRIQPMYDSTVLYIKTFMSGIYCKKYVATGSYQQQKLPVLSVFPNPSNGVFQIQMPTEITLTTNNRISVIDISGRTVQSQLISKTNFPLEMQNLPNGTYQLILSNEERNIARATVQLQK